jgi:hypothetical protein
VNLCFLPGIYGAWELYRPNNPIASATWSIVVLSVQINLTFLVALLGYLYWYVARYVIDIKQCFIFCCRLDLVIIYSKKTKSIANSRAGQLSRLRIPTIVIIVFLLLVNVAANIVRVIAFGAGEGVPSLYFATFVFDLSVSLIIGLFTIIMLIIGMWFLVFLHKQEQASIKTATIKVGAYHSDKFSHLTRC